MRIPYQIDSTDRKILGLLESDARRSNAEIAREVGMSAPAVAERIAKLRDNGILERFTAIIDPEQINLRVAAFVEFQPHGANDERVLQRIAQFSAIKDCYRVTGTAFLMLFVRVEDHLRLKELIAELSRIGTSKTTVILDTQFERRPYFANARAERRPTEEK